jgi:hypothetical protein
VGVLGMGNGYGLNSIVKYWNWNSFFKHSAYELILDEWIIAFKLLPMKTYLYFF